MIQYGEKYTNHGADVEANKYIHDAWWQIEYGNTI
jgi:hypothetical protein